MTKPIANTLYNWATTDEYGALRVRGQVNEDHDKAHAKKGEYLITSQMLRIYLENGIRYLETKNSLYILVDEKSPPVQPVKIKGDDLKVGDIVAEMHLHQSNSGTMKGWVAYQPFEITEDTYEDMKDRFFNNADWNNKVIGNKYARVLNFTVDKDGFVSTALVLYTYDHRFYSAQLVDPVWADTLGYK